MQWFFLFKAGILVFLVTVAGSLPIVSGKGMDWINVSSLVTESLFDVFMIDADDGWIVGDSGTILHWDGVEWTQVTSPTAADLRGVYMLSTNEGWAVGLNGVTIHWDGIEWTQVTSGSSANLLDIGVTSNVLVYSEYYTLGVGGTILNWTGAEWSQETSPTTANLRGTDTYFQPPSMECYGWIVGSGGTILSYSDSLEAWPWQSSPTTTELNDVSVVDATNAWAVGAGWTILHYVWPTGWESVASPISDYGYLTTVDMVDANNGWAMGYSGRIIHWDGIEWTEVGSPTSNTLNSVSIVDANDGWAVGSGGTILQWTGTEWIPELNPVLVMPLLMGVTFVIISLGKTTFKHRKSTISKLL